LGEIIEGKYEVLEKLAEGGMGAVYKVRHIHLDKIQVIKTIRSEYQADEETRQRFLREARMATGLNHPNIASMLDFSVRADLTAYMVMEFVSGHTVAQLDAQLPVRAVVDIGRQCLAALGYLHRKGIVHRDISPQNLMLTRDETGSLVVKLIDLGVAKNLNDEGFTATGVFVGKLRYCSPEQLGALAHGERLDGRGDLYSLGCVLYLMLTGRTAVDGESLQTFIAAHLRKAPLSFEESDPTGRVPQALRDVVMRALKKKRTERWPTAQAFADALAAVERELPPDPPAEVDRLHELSATIAWTEVTPSRGRPAAEPEPAAVSEMSTTIEVPETSPLRSQRKLALHKPGPSPSWPPPRAPHVQAAPRSSPTKPSPTHTAEPPPRNHAVLLGAAALVVILAGVFGALKVWPMLKARGAPAVPASTVSTVSTVSSGHLTIVAMPWAQVVGIKPLDSGPDVKIETTYTPRRLDLPPGRYAIRLLGPGGSPEIELRATVLSDQEARIFAEIPGYDLEAAVRSYAP